MILPLRCRRIVLGLRQSVGGDTIAEGTASGLGIALLPTFIAGRYLAEGRLVDALPGWRGEPAPIYALYPHNRHLSAKVRLFVDYLAERYRGTPAWEVQA